MSGENINTPVLASTPAGAADGATTTGKGTQGTLPNGMQYAGSINQLGVNDANGILIGGGNMYLTPVTGLVGVPDDEYVETEANLIGIVSGGFKITNDPKITSVYNQFEQLVSNFVINEKFTIKTGIVTWNQQNLSMLSTGTTYNTTVDCRTVWTGTNSLLPQLLLRFVKVNPDGSILRFTMVGQAGKGFGMEFGSKPVSVDCELESIAYFQDFVAEIRVTPSGTQQPGPGVC